MMKGRGIEILFALASECYSWIEGGSLPLPMLLSLAFRQRNYLLPVHRLQPRGLICDQVVAGLMDSRNATATPSTGIKELNSGSVRAG